MILVTDTEVCVTCDCPTCPGQYAEPKPVTRESLLASAEDDGWFVERFPGKSPRHFCPAHADAYRTMFDMVMRNLASRAEVVAQRNEAWSGRHRSMLAEAREKSRQLAAATTGRACSACGETGHTRQRHAR